ncbi:MAG: MarR family winged helix-turn-helix transcriptional regulator [Flavobacteriia bacterium]|jgi:DNA-binding MarR family transcriptional regulator|nr:MarR family winged helix-turn-helix transcriptional regulator [Cryomorphaceae bacterium]
MSKHPEQLVDFVVRHAWHRLSRMYNQKAAEHDITMSIGFILMSIDKEGTPSTALGPRMGMEPTSLSRTLKTMEDRGFIVRKESSEDKRKVLIFLTPVGVEKRREVRNFVVGFNDELTQRVSEKKLEIFFEVFNAIDVVIEKEVKKD